MAAPPPPPSVSLPRHPLHASLSSSSLPATPHQLRFSSPAASPRRISHAASAATLRVQGMKKKPLRRSNAFVSPKSAKHEPVRTVMVEDEGVALEGVAKVERDAPARAASSSGRIALLAGGDILALLIFAAAGRLSHGLSVLNWDVVETADPFIAGWLLGAYFLGGFGPEGQGLKGLPKAALAAAKSWTIGIPLGLAIRAFSTGHPPQQAFILVSMASTFVLLIGWRSVLIAVFASDDSSQKSRQGDKQGSVFELFELLSSLIRRW